MTAARRSSWLAFGLSLFCTFTSTSALAIDPSTDLDPATHWIVLGDFNGDGLVDALYQPMDETSDGGILLQDSSGNLTVLAQGWTSGYLGLDWNSDVTTLNAADLNGDGLADIIAQPNQPGGNASVLFAVSNASTTYLPQFLQIGQVIPPNFLGFDWSSSTHTVVAGDFDGDHHAELFMQAVNPGDSGYIVHTDVNGQLAAIVQTISDGYLGRTWNASSVTLYVGDFNGDGRQDLLIQVNPGVSLSESAYALVLADANGQFTSIAQTWNASDLGGEWDPTTHQIVVEDANGDGIMDITLRSIDPNGTNYVFLGNAQGVFTQPAATWVGTQSASDVLNPPQSGGGGGGGDGGGSGGSGSTTTRGIGFGGDSLSANSTAGAPPLAPPDQDPPVLLHPGAPGSTGNTGSGSIVIPTAVGALQGSAGVSGGTATYSIPIAIPPGIAGMKPSVSLSYSSRGGNGEAGMGWSLSAGSQIHRCPATQAMDGYSIGVTYSSTDRLCLDGQHLVLITGAYGQNGATYRTELDSFSIITETGNITGTGSTGSYFTVQQKDGHTSTYGNTADSVFVASGVTDPLAWGISKEVDAHTNNITYGYIGPNSSVAPQPGPGEYLLSKINYTGTGSASGTREVDFTYAPRLDVTSQYLAGGITNQTLLLFTISSSVANVGQGMSYQLEYRNSVTTNRSLLAGVQECAGISTRRACLPETGFAWHNPATSFATPVNVGEDLDANAPRFAEQANQMVVSSPGDLDGDGRKEVMYYRPGKYTRVYFLNADGSVRSWADITKLFGNVLYTTGDINNDGADDLLGEVDGSGGAEWLGYVTYTGDVGNTATFSAVHNLGIPYGAVIHGQFLCEILAVKDMDGDGLPDILSYTFDPVSQQYTLQLRINDTAPNSTTPHFKDPVSLGTLDGSVGLLSVNGDVNGDGLPDITVSIGTQLLGYSFSVRDPSTHAISYTSTYSTASLGIDNRAVDTRQYNVIMDINGDGLKDMVFDCWNGTAMDLCYQLNTGKVGGNMFAPTVNSQALDPLDENMQSGAFQADLDNDGVDELVYPYTLEADYCIYEHGVKTADGNVTVESCAHSGDYGKALAASDDFSIYKYHRIKFQATADSGQAGGYRYVPVGGSTGIIAQSHLAVPMDLQGDGLTDVVSPFTNWYEFGHFKKIDSSYQSIHGVSIASNNASSSNGKNAAPDLMTVAEDGFGLTSTWTYYPISSPVSFNKVPLYYAPNITDSGRYANSDYFYFASSMYVVGSFTQGNGTSTFSSDDYHYAQAIYNNQGRGFQGFHTVVDDDMITKARTVELYHQRFPLSGELEESWVTPQSSSFQLASPAMDSNAVEHVVDSWGCMQGTGATFTAEPANGSIPAITCDSVLDANASNVNTFVPVLAESIETRFDLVTHDNLSTTDTVYCPVSGTACMGAKPGVGATWSEGYDTLGNAVGSVTTITDHYGPSSQPQVHSGTYISAVSDSYTVASSTWDRLDSKTTTVQASYDGSGSGPVTRNTTYSNYLERMPQTVTALPGSAFSILTTYSYNRGNVTDVTVSAPADATFHSRHTHTDYTTGSDANYFPLDVIDPMLNKTLMTTDPVLGEALTATDPNGIVTTNKYDVFGRKSATIASAAGMPSIEQDIYYYEASDGNCPLNDGTGTRQYYVETIQKNGGAPTHYTCYDELNRVMRNASESIANNVVYQDTIYDNRGHVIQSSEPYFAGGTPLWNVDAFDDDILGRMNLHTTANNVSSAYTHADLTTDIKTTSLTDAERDDEEIKNSLGKLMTVINITNDSTQTAQTQYGYDSDGNPATITSVDGAGVGTSSSTISALYDILGHKYQVADPDQGTAKYTYDILGELTAQADANALAPNPTNPQQTSMSYDNDGRMTFKQTPDGSSSTWCYDGQTFSGTPGTCSGSAVAPSIGKLTVLTKDSGTQYQEVYSYDGFSRVSLDRQILDGGAYDTATTYDTQGHVATVTYPSSVVDAPPVVTASTSASYAVAGNTITLTATASDPDNGPQPLDYQWTQTGGPPVTLSTPTALTSSFTIPSGNGNTYSFSFTADDGLLTSTPATVSVGVQALPSIASVSTDGDTDHDGSYGVNWTTNSIAGPAPAYHLQQAVGTDSVTVPAASAFTDITTTTSTSYSPVTHFGNGSYYYWYQVYGVDLSGPGSTSTPVSIHVVVKPGAPAFISPASGSGYIGATYTISWGAYSGSVEASKVFYELYEATSSNFSGQTLAYSGTALSQGLSKGNNQGNTTYYYRVRACNQSDGTKVCSSYASAASYYVSNVGGGGGGGGGCPPAPEQCQLVMQDPLAVFTPSEIHTSDPIAPITGTPGIRARAAYPHFAAPVNEAWKDAHLRVATGGGTVTQLTVQYNYDPNTGYLMSLTDAVDSQRTFWALGTLNARGQVKTETYGPDAGSAAAVLVNHTYDDASGFEKNVTGTTGALTVQNMNFTWTAAGNLMHRDASVPVIVGGNTTHVSLSEEFTYDLHNRLKTATVSNQNGAQNPVTYAYSPTGNILCKSDAVGHDCNDGTNDYAYDPNTDYVYGGTGPHALTKIGSAQYGYDADGNMTSRNGTTISWNSDNLPTQITQDANNNSAFSYAPDKHRYKQVASYSGSPETTYYAGGLEIVKTGTGSSTLSDFRHTLTAYGRPVVLARYQIDPSSNKPVLHASYLLNDQIGSMNTLVDGATGTPSPLESFDAFGARRDETSWHGAPSAADVAADRTVTHRGLTGHEELDNVALIHMNGRVYDPTVGRFLSVDPLVQAPANTQSINPYSYVMNNPLSLTDPSGYAAACSDGDSTACPNELAHGNTFNDTATGSHIDEGRQGAAGQKLDAAVRKLGGIANTLGILKSLGKLGGDVGKAMNNLAGGIKQYFGGNGIDGWQNSADAQHKPSDIASINSPATAQKKDSQPAVGTTDGDTTPSAMVIDKSETQSVGSYSIFHYKLKNAKGKTLTSSDYSVQEHLWKDKAHTQHKDITNNSEMVFIGFRNGEVLDAVGYEDYDPQDVSFKVFQTFTVGYKGKTTDLNTEFEHITTVNNPNKDIDNDVIDMNIKQ